MRQPLKKTQKMFYFSRQYDSIPENYKKYGIDGNEENEMAGSTFGELFRVTTWGESHGKAVGAVVDGCPAGLELSEEDIQRYLDRRKPGQNRYTTKRSESDTVRILSGVFEGKTTGTPISLLVPNEDQHSKDYSNLKDVYRPGHADLGFDAKYGFRDYRGGGRSSGRETIGRVAAGAVAAKILQNMGIRVQAYVASVGPVDCDPSHYDEVNLAEYLDGSRLQMPDREAEARAEAYLEECMKDGDSSGGIVECIVTGMPAGIGEPVFDKLDALLGQAIFSIGAVKGVEIGDGFAAARARGSQNNDQYGRNSMYADNSGEVTAGDSADNDNYDGITAGESADNDKSGEHTHKLREGGMYKNSNHAGGILGGISDGSDIRIRAAFKPTPSISPLQHALGRDGRVHDLEIKGRHDPLIAPRAAVVVECMTAITVLDLLMRNMNSRMDSLSF